MFVACMNKPDGDQALTAELKFDYNLMQIVLSNQIQVFYKAEVSNSNQAKGGEMGMQKNSLKSVPLKNGL